MSILKYSGSVCLSVYKFGLVKWDKYVRRIFMKIDLGTVGKGHPILLLFIAISFGHYTIATGMI